MVRRKHTLLALAVIMGSTLTVAPVLAVADPDRPVSSRANERQQIVEERKQEIRDRVTAMREARQAMVDEKRLEACKKREIRINRIVAKSTQQAEKHLAVFQKIEERVKQFYADKNLSAEGYEAMTASVDEKEAAAIAAIDVARETSFDCDSTDSAEPGKLVRDLMKSQHQALKNYRTAIKDLIVSVKTAAESQNETRTEAEGES